MPGKRIVMIGTRRDVRGGISAMVNVYFAHGLFDRWNARYLATHCDGGKLRKAAQAAASWLSFMGLLLTGRVALAHVHIASDASFWRKSLFIVPAHLMRVPYVLHMHGGNFIEFYRTRNALVRRFIRWIYARANRVIALSQEWREALLALQPESRVVVIPNPVEIPSWQAILEGTPPTVLFLGVIKERKGVHDLLRAWPAVLRAAPDARLVLGGVGDVEEAKALAHELHVGDSVEMPGWIVGAAKDALMKRAWVFVLPSHYEALPMSVLEAMAAGVPVVASRVGGIPAAIEDGRTGILIEPRDIDRLASSLVALLIAGERRKAMGDAARRQAAASYSADVLVPGIDSLWRERVPQLEVAPAISGAGSRSRPVRSA